MHSIYVKLQGLAIICEEQTDIYSRPQV